LLCARRRKCEEERVEGEEHNAERAEEDVKNGMRGAEKKKERKEEREDGGRKRG
jgi:hypothetical protein